MADDYGMLVSQAGLDVLEAADYELLVSSGWPLLKIEATGVVNANNDSGSTPKTLFTHNLGYPPLFIVQGIDWDLYTPQPGTTRLAQYPELYVDNNTLGMDAYGYFPANIRFFIFRQPLNKPFQAPTYKLSASTEGDKDKDYGLKVLKSGKKESSTDLRDYTYHSGTRSPMLHNITTGPLTGSGTNYNLDWTNDLPYKPTTFIFHSNDNVKFNAVPGGSQTVPRSTVYTSGNANLNNSSGTYGSIVTLKDPFAVGIPQVITI